VDPSCALPVIGRVMVVIAGTCMTWLSASLPL
jgi:hypothetical protein